MKPQAIQAVETAAYWYCQFGIRIFEFMYEIKFDYPSFAQICLTISLKCPTTEKNIFFGKFSQSGPLTSFLYEIKSFCSNLYYWFLFYLSTHSNLFQDCTIVSFIFEMGTYGQRLKISNKFLIKFRQTNLCLSSLNSKLGYQLHIALPADALLQIIQVHSTLDIQIY